MGFNILLLRLQTLISEREIISDPVILLAKKSIKRISPALFEDIILHVQLPADRSKFSL